MKFLKKILNKEVAFAVLVVAILISLIFQINALSRTVDGMSNKYSSMIGEIGEIKSVVGDEINAIRDYIRIPSRQIFAQTHALDEEKPDGEDKNKDEIQLKLVEYVNFVGSKKQKESVSGEYAGYLSALRNYEPFLEVIESSGLFELSFDDNEANSFISYGGDDGEYIKFFLDKSDGTLFFKSPLEKKSIEVSNFDELSLIARDYVQKNKEQISKRINSITTAKASVSEAQANPEISAYLAENNASIGEPFEENLVLIYAISNSENAVVGKINLYLEDLSLELSDVRDTQNKLMVTDLNVSLLPFLKSLDLSTLLDQKVKEAKESLDKMFADSGFRAILEQYGMKISIEPEEDSSRYYYKIFDASGEHLNSIVIEKATGTVNIVDINGANSENLLLFSPEEKKNSLAIPDEIPDYGDELSHEDSTFNVLLAGKHGNLVDTMIFAHVNETRREVRMISIPRDLFYKGRKINSFAYFYGMDELKRALSELTGYKLDKYVLIDMFAFIDVIDLIGGVDVRLDKPVIDPTYVTEDNGVWGTLHYEPGDYHFSGKQALRIARSRYTSSDFARAERQQIILKALQNKARNMGFGDADTFYQIVRTVLAKTDTDISLDEAIAYYFRYQNYDIISNDVMHSGNVLYVPPYVTVAQCEARIAVAQAAGQAIPNCMNENHAYTLLPRNNNWNIVKWYFKEKFEA